MNRISTFLTFLVYLAPIAICLIIARLIYHHSIFKNNFEFIEVVLFGLLFIASIIVSIINFRDSSENLIFFQKVKIAKLHVAIGLLLIPLLMFYGVTTIKMVDANSNKNRQNALAVEQPIDALKARIVKSVNFLSTQLDTLRDSVTSTSKSQTVPDSAEIKLLEKIDSLSIDVGSIDSKIAKIDSLVRGLQDSMISKTDSPFKALQDTTQ